MPAGWRNTVGRSARPAALPTQQPARSPTFLEHYASRQFHSRITCSRTGSAVTFAQGGDLNSRDVVLYSLPSGCSRYLILLLDGVCRKAGVRIIGLDRPGSGGTTPCSLKDRIAVSTSHSVSVLRALDLIDDQMCPTGPPITLLSHSVGVIYALALLKHFEDIRSQAGPGYYTSPLGTCPRLLLCSPWVPVSISKSPLGLLPPSLIRLNASMSIQKIAATVQGSLGAVTNSSRGLLDWSSGGLKTTLAEDRRRADDVCAAPDIDNPFLTVTGTEPPPSPQSHRGQKIRAAARQRHPDATFLPPHESHYKYSTSLRAFPSSNSPPMAHPATGKPFQLTTETGTQVICDFMIAEGSKGVTEDFLLALGHAPEIPNSELERLLRSGVAALAEIPAGTNVTSVWADGDKLVPTKGRSWLDGIFFEAVRTSRGRVSYERLEMAEAGHDMPVVSEAVIVDLLRRAKQRMPTSQGTLPAQSLPLPRPSNIAAARSPQLCEGASSATSSPAMESHPFADPSSRPGSTTPYQASAMSAS
ncbi:unnamed protein product [Parajaminaea phylloscopi]